MHNKLHFYVLIVILYLLSNGLYSQFNFQKVYADAGYIRRIIKTHDNNIAFWGDPCGYALVKTDLSGNLLWSVSIDGTSSSHTIRPALAQLNNNSYVMLHGGQGATCLMNYNDSGIFEYGLRLNELYYNLIATSDGGYFLVGESHIAKFAANGNFLWEKNPSVSGWNVIETYDNGFVITAKQTHGDHSDYVIFKTDPNGNIEWSKSLHNYGVMWGWPIVETMDHGLVFAGKSAYPDSVTSLIPMHLLKVDMNGNLVWAKKYSSTEHAQPKDIGILSNGDLIVVGNITHTSVLCNSLSLWFRTDSTGNLMWARGSCTFGSDHAECVVVKDDQNIYIGSDNEGMTLTKIDQFGNGFCDARDVPFLVENESLPLMDVTIGQVGLGNSMTAYTPVEVHLLTPIQTICSDIIGIEESLYTDVNIISNPFNHSIIIKADFEQRPKVTMINLQGQHIQCTIEESGDELIIHPIDISSGLYYLRIQCMNTIFTYKVIKE